MSCLSPLTTDTVSLFQPLQSTIASASIRSNWQLHQIPLSLVSIYSIVPSSLAIQSNAGSPFFHSLPCNLHRRDDDNLQRSVIDSRIDRHHRNRSVIYRAIGCTHRVACRYVNTRRFQRNGRVMASAGWRVGCTLIAAARRPERINRSAGSLLLNATDD